MGSKSSIEKLDEQISMLQNKEFVAKTRNNTKQKRTTPRKVIMEEPTVVEEDLMSDLISDHEDTKVLAQVSDSKIENKKDEKKNNDSKPITKKIEITDKPLIDYNKLYDVYLPVAILVLIIIFLLLIIFI